MRSYGQPPVKPPVRDRVRESVKTRAEELEVLERELRGHGPWEPVPSELPPPGGRTLWNGLDGTASVGTAARIARELRGMEQLGSHPARPEIVLATEHALLFAPLGPIAPAPLEVVSAWPGERKTLEGTRRELLRTLESEIDVPRALRRSGLKRRHVDLWLDARAVVEARIGPSLGGVHPAFLRAQGARVVSLRCERARGEGWRAMDLAGLALAQGAPLAAIRAAHDGNDEAMDLALVVVLMREARGELPPLVRAIVEPSPEPERVRVFIDAPDFVDTDVWSPRGAELPASRARWLLATLDGLSVGGGKLSVRTEPPIRRGRRPSPREDRDARRRRLFSRWHEGIRADEEGLVGATPEALAQRIASGLRGVVIDGTCGVGSIAIACAREPGVTKVVAVDRDRTRLAMAAHNASIYGVSDRIDFVRGDLLELLGRLRGDTLVIDPPWGGASYDRERVAIEDVPFDLAGAIAAFSGAIVLKLPRSFDVATLPGLSSGARSPDARFARGAWSVEAMVDERGILKFLVARRM
jgi:trimethylguanosine synthase